MLVRVVTLGTRLREILKAEVTGKHSMLRNISDLLIYAQYVYASKIIISLMRAVVTKVTVTCLETRAWFW